MCLRKDSVVGKQRERGARLYSRWLPRSTPVKMTKLPLASSRSVKDKFGKRVLTGNTEKALYSNVWESGEGVVFYILRVVLTCRCMRHCQPRISVGGSCTLRFAGLYSSKLSGLVGFGIGSWYVISFFLSLFFSLNNVY